MIIAFENVNSLVTHGDPMWPMAIHPWPMAINPWSLAIHLWPMAIQLWPMAIQTVADGYTNCGQWLYNCD